MPTPIQTLARFKDILEERRSKRPINSIIEFRQYQFHFSYFENVNLDNCHFIECEFMLCAWFNVPNLNKTRFPRSIFKQGLRVDLYIASQFESGLFQGDFDCQDLKIAFPNKLVPYLTELKCTDLLDGYEINRQATDTTYQLPARQDKPKVTQAALNIIKETLCLTTLPAFERAIHYAYALALLAKTDDIQSKYLASASQAGFKHVKSKAIFATEGESSINFLDYNLNNLVFNDCFFGNTVELTSTELTTINFLNCEFDAAVSIDYRYLQRLLGANFKNCHCNYIMCTYPKAAYQDLFPIKPFTFFHLFHDYYAAQCQNNGSPPDFSDLLTPQNVIQAERTLLEFLSSKSVYDNPNTRAALTNMTMDITLAEKALANKLNEDERRKVANMKLFSIQVMKQHSSFFTTDDLYHALIAAIQQQKYTLLESLCRFKRFSLQNIQISQRIKSFETLLGHLRFENNQLDLLQLALYYVKFINPSAIIFSKLHSKYKLSEPLFREIYEYALPFNAELITSRLPPIRSTHSFFDSDSEVSESIDSLESSLTSPTTPAPA